MTKKIALVILEQTDGKVTLQLRDDKMTIAHPNLWALFGGKIEEGENPQQAALREVAEELTIQLHANSLTFLQKFALEQQKEHFLFHLNIRIYQRFRRFKFISASSASPRFTPGESI